MSASCLLRTGPPHSLHQTLDRRAANLQGQTSLERPGHLRTTPTTLRTTPPPLQIFPTLPTPPPPPPLTLRLLRSSEEDKTLGSEQEVFLRPSPTVYSWEMDPGSSSSLLTSDWARVGQQLPHGSCLCPGDVRRRNFSVHTSAAAAPANSRAPSLASSRDRACVGNVNGGRYYAVSPSCA